MNILEKRIEKLEQAQPEAKEWPNVIHLIPMQAIGDKPKDARHIKLHDGTVVTRLEGESSHDFNIRALGMQRASLAQHGISVGLMFTL